LRPANLSYSIFFYLVYYANYSPSSIGSSVEILGSSLVSSSADEGFLTAVMSSLVFTSDVSVSSLSLSPSS